MLANNRTTNLHSQLTHQQTLGRYVGRYVHQKATDILVNMSTDISVAWRSIYQVRYQLCDGQHIDQYIGRYVDQYDVYRPRGAKIQENWAIFLKMLLKVIVNQKGHVGEIQYFG